MAKFEFNSRDPIYLQLIDYIRREIVAGHIVAGQSLPSRRQIARDFGINPNTVQRAFSEMEGMGWINTEPNRPSQLTEDSDRLQEIKDEFLHNTVKEFVESVKTLDVDKDKIIQLVEKNLNNGGDTRD